MSQDQDQENEYMSLEDFLDPLSTNYRTGDLFRMIAVPDTHSYIMNNVNFFKLVYERHQNIAHNACNQSVDEGSKEDVIRTVGVFKNVFDNTTIKLNEDLINENKK